MKKYYFTIIFFFNIINLTIAQPYANNWINYSQKYIKFKITTDGIYRIDKTALTTALNKIGMDVNTINPQNIQLFGRGEEQYIYVEGENDGTFNSNDYIEFYTQHNDGWLDSQIYDTPQSQPNPYLSLFNDTATYFLTINNFTNNKRYTTANDVNFNGLSPVNFIKKIEIQIDPNVMSSATYYRGWEISEKPDVRYTNGEGWFFQWMQGVNKSKNINLNTPNPYLGSDGFKPVFSFGMAGMSNPSGNADHHFQAAIGSFVRDTVFNDRNFFHKNYALNISDISNGITTSTFSNLADAASATISSVSYVRLIYPHAASLAGEAINDFEFEVTANSIAKTFVQLTVISAGSIPVIYDLTDHKRVTTSFSSGKLKFILPAGTIQRNCVFTDFNSVNTITNFEAAGNTGTFTDYSNFITDSVFLMISHPKLMTEANNYKNYRTSKGKNVILADIKQLNDQFAYGIAQHPLSVRNFCKYAFDNFNSPPTHLFIVGKSVDPISARKDAFDNVNTLIPTWGDPASDSPFTAFFGTNLFENAIPTGRLAAQTPQHVAIYLNKVILHEQALANATDASTNSIDDMAWTKQVLHFGGGSGVSQQAVFKGYLEKYAATIEKVKFGGEVTAFYKETATPIDGSLADVIRQKINAGVAIMTFFGHSSAQGFDISVDDPSTYDNIGKYPLVVANGCFNGNIHLTPKTFSTSESFVLSEKGAIGYIATSNIGIAQNLDQYSDTLYKEMANLSYGKDVGEQMRQAVIKLQQGNAAPNVFVTSTIQEMGLHGDPSMKLITYRLPDYAIEIDKSISFTPDFITSEIDSFDFNVAIYNIGNEGNQLDSFNVSVKRFFPSSSQTVTYTKRIASFGFLKQVIFRMPIDLAKGIGKNEFEVRVDSDFEIGEMSESNNTILQPRVEKWISSNDLVPIYPYNYAIVPDSNITLIASTGNPFATQKDYVLQLGYNNIYSPMLGFQTVSSIGGVIKWKPPVSFKADSVYFWRAKPIADTNWREFSFHYLPGKTGWGQSRFDQYKNNNYSLLKYDKIDKKINFFQEFKTLRVRVLPNPTTFDERISTNYSIGGEHQDGGICNGQQSIFIIVIDSATLKPWLQYHPVYNPDPTKNFGNQNNGNCIECHGGGCNSADKYFMFRNNQTQLDSMAKMVSSKIPKGNYLLMYTGINGQFQSSWKPNHFQAFKDLGATAIDTVADNVAYIFFTKVGSPASTKEIVGISPSDFLDGSFEMTNSATFGDFTTPIMGPSSAWNQIVWNYTSTDNVKDSVNIQILGIDTSGIETVVKEVGLTEIDTININNINAATYPYLKIHNFIEDNVMRTSAQFNEIQIYYEPVPEAALNNALSFTFQSDTVQEGETVRFSIAIENISPVDMDSLNVNYWIEDVNGMIIPIPYTKQAPLKAGAVLIDTVSYQTKGLRRNNLFWIDVNPENSNWQLEQFHFNNIARKYFYVSKDKINPILDVTFDGLHILDGDIISPKPAIYIELSDENKFLALNDTSSFSVYITNPNGVRALIPFIDKSGVEILTFTKANLPKNKASIEYNPTFLHDGTYVLSVTAKDASNNNSGDKEYKISFEVVNKSTITDVLNYPNPFTTSTRFVFTLTGMEIPDEFKIQILTISGKVIREITTAEIGSLNIGRNITEFAWDGTDEFGGYLANGVYLYRVISSINGKTIEHRVTAADKFFKKNFGKMYLMR